MGLSYVGEIRMVGFDFAPNGWAFCNGQILNVDSDLQPLALLLGSTYGGDGINTVGLPDLRGRRVVHPDGVGFSLAGNGGVETVTLTQAQVPTHRHPVNVYSHPGTSNTPQGNYMAVANGTARPYVPSAGSDKLLTSAVGSSGGAGGVAQPHENMPPFQVLNFIISLFGVFPTPT